MGSQTVQQSSNYCSSAGNPYNKKYIEWGADLVFPHPSVSLINIYLYSLLRRSDITWNIGKEKERKDIIRRGKLLIDWRYHAAFWEDHQLKDLNGREICLPLLTCRCTKTSSETWNYFLNDCGGGPYRADSANMIWCFVRRLRKKLEKSDPEAVKMIQSIRKVGYYLDIG